MFNKTIQKVKNKINETHCHSAHARTHSAHSHTYTFIRSDSFACGHTALLLYSITRMEGGSGCLADFILFEGMVGRGGFKVVYIAYGLVFMFRIAFWLYQRRIRFLASLKSVMLKCTKFLFLY